jgi:hypothetical protein
MITRPITIPATTPGLGPDAPVTALSLAAVAGVWLAVGVRPVVTLAVTVCPVDADTDNEGVWEGDSVTVWPDDADVEMDGDCEPESETESVWDDDAVTVWPVDADAEIVGVCDGENEREVVWDNEAKVWPDDADGENDGDCEPEREIDSVWDDEAVTVWPDDAEAEIVGVCVPDSDTDRVWEDERVCVCDTDTGASWVAEADDGVWDGVGSADGDSERVNAWDAEYDGDGDGERTNVAVADAVIVEVEVDVDVEVDVSCRLAVEEGDNDAVWLLLSVAIREGDGDMEALWDGLLPARERKTLLSYAPKRHSCLSPPTTLTPPLSSLAPKGSYKANHNVQPAAEHAGGRPGSVVHGPITLVEFATPLLSSNKALFPLSVEAPPVR